MARPGCLRGCLPNIGDEHHVHAPRLPSCRLPSTPAALPNWCLASTATCAIEHLPTADSTLTLVVTSPHDRYRLCSSTGSRSLFRGTHMTVLLSHGTRTYPSPFGLGPQSQVVPRTCSGTAGDGWPGIPALAFRVCDVVREIGSPDLRPRHGCVDHHAPHVALVHDGPLDLHQRV